MSCCLDMEALRPDIYLTDEQKERMRSELHPPTLAERIKTLWEIPTIINFLKIQASELRRTTSPHCRNIQPVDVDQLADVFEALGSRLEETTPHCENEGSK